MYDELIELVQPLDFVLLTSSIFKNQDLNKCVFHYFDEQYAFCRSCVIVNNETMEDSNNCRCLQCALSSLNNSCFQDYCTSGDEYKKLQIFIEQFQRVIGAVDNGVSLKSRNNKFSSKKLSYFVDQNHTVFRNPLPFEKTQLISALLTSLTNNQNRKTPLDIFKKVDMHSETQRLRKRRRTKKKIIKKHLRMKMKMKTEMTATHLMGGKKTANNVMKV